MIRIMSWLPATPTKSFPVQTQREWLDAAAQEVWWSAVAGSFAARDVSSLSIPLSAACCWGNGLAELENIWAFPTQVAFLPT